VFIAAISLTRGFTGHEHLDQVGLIHMGGRVYDPELGRFLLAGLRPNAGPGTCTAARYDRVLRAASEFQVSRTLSWPAADRSFKPRRRDRAAAK
jgi:RHS repeat-associated protein